MTSLGRTTEQNIYITLCVSSKKKLTDVEESKILRQLIDVVCGIRMDRIL